MAITTNSDPRYDSRTYDDALLLCDSSQTLGATEGTVDIMEVDSASKIIDIGASMAKGDFVVDVASFDVDDNDELGLILLQGSNSATFASGIVNLACMPIGALEVTGESVDDAGNARYIIPFRNNKKATTYRYLRGAVLTSGTTGGVVVDLAFLALRQ